jgi:hypothetical protein
MSFSKVDELPRELYETVERMEAEEIARQAEEERKKRMLKVCRCPWP